MYVSAISSVHMIAHPDSLMSLITEGGTFLKYTTDLAPISAVELCKMMYGPAMKADSLSLLNARQGATVAR